MNLSSNVSLIIVAMLVDTFGSHNKVTICHLAINLCLINGNAEREKTGKSGENSICPLHWLDETINYCMIYELKLYTNLHLECMPQASNSSKIAPAH